MQMSNIVREKKFIQLDVCANSRKLRVFDFESQLVPLFV